MKTILVISILIILVIALNNIIFTKLDENFAAQPSYADCISKGYSKAFCVQTPVSVMGPSTCTCPDGNIGTIMPGFRGGCICNKNGMLR